MTRDELYTRSEGALEVTETAQDHADHLVRVLEAPDWIQQLRLEPSLIRDEVERESELTKAVARIDKLDPHALKPLGEARKRLTKLAADRLRELGLKPTATKLEDLLAQLVARAVDMTWEDDRIARSWKRIDRGRLKLTAGGIAAAVPSLGAFYALAMTTSVWVAAAPIAVYVIGLGVLAVRSEPPCPKCGRPLKSIHEPCVYCHHTRPPD